MVKPISKNENILFKRISPGLAKFGGKRLFVGTGLVKSIRRMEFNLCI